MDIGVITIIIQLIFLEGILSIDNAAVLGAMVRHLPADRGIPWPRWMHRIAHRADRLFGAQRQAALKVGLLGAYAGRALMLVLAGIIIHNPWLRIAGALYLLYLAISHFSDIHHSHKAEENAGEALMPAKGGFWATVLAIELADLAFSVDNVIAAVALSDRLWVVMIGVAIGIVVMRFAATLFTRMISWEPALETGAYLLLVAIGVELLLDEFWGIHLVEWQQFAVSASVLLLTILVARTPLRKPVRFIFRPVLALTAGITGIFGWLRNALGALFSRRDGSPRHLHARDES